MFKFYIEFITAKIISYNIIFPRSNKEVGCHARAEGRWLATTKVGKCVKKRRRRGRQKVAAYENTRFSISPTDRPRETKTKTDPHQKKSRNHLVLRLNI